jgi:hypothetical protein
MLSVLVKISVDFTNIPGGAGQLQAFRDTVYNLLKDNYFASRLCFRRSANFQLSAGARGNVPSFDRCLLHFIPSFYTAGTGDDSPTGPGDLINTAPPHMTVTFPTAGPVEVWTPPGAWSPAPAGPPSLAIRVPGALLFPPLSAATYTAAARTVATRIWTRCLELLGLVETSPPAASSYFTPASFLPIVGTVIDAGVPPPVIS